MQTANKHGSVDVVRGLARRNPLLAAATALFLAAFLAALIGLALDPRVITGAPAWLKPAKFGISTALYMATVIWLTGYITVWPRLTRALAHVIALVMVIEDVLIFAQACRGAASHFNVSTPLDAALFAVMGASIGVLWLASLGLCVALFRSQFSDAALALALRWGMAISVAGSGMGGLMVQPTPAQRAELQADHRPAAIGAHSVGVADGGPGLPGVGWSTAGGDLRIPHFFGLHAVQLLPFALWWRRRSREVGARWVGALAASYAGLTALLLWQALRAEPLIYPSPLTLATFALWAVLSVAALTVWSGRRRPHPEVYA